MIGLNIYDFFLPEFHSTVRKKISGVYETGNKDYYELATEFNSDLRSWYMTRLSPVIRNGDVMAVTLFIRDITDLKNAEQQLKEINEDLELRVLERTQALQTYTSRLESSEILNTSLRYAKSRNEVIAIIVENGKMAFNSDLAGFYYL